MHELCLTFSLPSLVCCRSVGARLDAGDSEKRVQHRPGQSGISGTLYWQVAAIFGAVAGRWLADRWMHRNGRARTWTARCDLAKVELHRWQVLARKNGGTRGRIDAPHAGR